MTLQEVFLELGLPKQVFVMVESLNRSNKHFCVIGGGRTAQIGAKLKPMAKLFQERGIFYGHSPVSLSSGFKKLLVKLKEPSPDVAAVLYHHISLLLRASACVAFPSDELSILVVFESGEKSEIAALIQREKKRLEYLCSSSSDSKQEISIDMEDDEISTGLVLREAIHRALLSALINQGWTSMQDNVLVFGNVACYQEGTPLQIISVDVQLESNNFVALLLSPDVACFHLAKPVKMMPQIWKRQFEDGKSISIEDYWWQCGEGINSDFQCFVLPSLREGYIEGFSKNLDGTQRPQIELSKQQWLNQNGIQLPAEYYYIKVRFASDLDQSVWFPSCLVLTKAGFVPAVPSIRCSKISQVVEHFKVSVAAWDFFNAGKIEFQAFPSTGDSSMPGSGSWTKATGLLNPYSGIAAPSGLGNTLCSSFELKSLQKSLRARPRAQVGALARENPETKTSLERGAVQSEQSLSTIASRESSCKIPKFTRAKPRDASVASSRRNKKPRLTNQLETGRNKGVLVEVEKNASSPRRGVPSQIPTSIIPLLPQEVYPASCIPVVENNRPADERSNEHSEKTGSEGANHKHSVEGSSKKKHGTLDDTETLVKRKHAEGTLKDLNVADLKNFLRIRKGKLGGKKEELIQRMHELLS